MRPICIFDDPCHKRNTEKPGNPKDTAYWIFDQAVKHSYSVNASHLKMKSGNADTPVVYDGSRKDLERIADEQITVVGRIWDMVEYFADGAQLGIPPKLASECYVRIQKHLAAHLDNMYHEKLYIAPEVDDFRHMAEFALTIRSRALVDNPQLDTLQFNLGFFGRSVRPSIVNKSHAVEAKALEVPRVMANMDSIERYLEMYGG